jgi:hypothetical protein
MCVIAVVEDSDKRPSREEVTAMWESNPQGGGVAWRESGRVKWKKGLGLNEMQRLVVELPTPYIAHFRVNSCGVGGAIPQLTHPFPIEPNVSFALEGEIEGAVLFHNGHWQSWEHQAKMWLGQAGGKIRVPHGQKWSDSRTMALFAYYFGYGIFDGDPWGIDQKVVIMGPGEDDLDFFRDADWSTYHGYIISNDYWIKKVKVAPGEDRPTEKVTAETSMFTSPPASMLPGIREQVSVNTPREAPVKDPFETAREAFDKAAYAWLLDEGSKNAMKRAKQELQRIGSKKPQHWKTFQAENRDYIKTLQLIELKTCAPKAGKNPQSKDLSDMGQHQGSQLN